ncbi:MAG: hypothetical protein Q7K65_03810 [Candidatus Buchananbacteria bacterium]|nr:hypothetical protein [Candidatus Buchananbacteria bacterium]
MPISQMSKINQIENIPPARKVESSTERGSSVSPEISPVEFGHDRLAEMAKPSPPAATMPAEPFAGANMAVDQRFKKIESILEEDLSEVYFNLNSQKQQEFRAKGEETAVKIFNLLAKPKVQIKKIISLIKDWLKIIPGINVFFLEQVVKIKADKIINETSKRN